MLARILSVIMLTVFAASCKEQLLVGKYIDEEHHNFFELHKDSTFKYSFLFDRTYSYSQGKWIKEKNIIILNSKPLTTDIPLAVAKSSSNKDGTILSIKTPLLTNKAFAIYDLYINDLFYKTLSAKDLDSVKISSDISSMYLVLYWSFDYWMNDADGPPNNHKWQTVRLNFSNPVINKNISIDVLVTNSLVYLVPFNSAKIIVKRNKLLFADYKDIGLLIKDTKDSL